MFTDLLIVMLALALAFLIVWVGVIVATWIYTLIEDLIDTIRFKLFKK